MSTQQGVLVASGTLRPAVTALLSDPQVLAHGHLVHAIFLGVRRLEWVGRAACSPETADLFHPDKSDVSAAVAQAKWICGRCPVVEECRAYIDAIETDLPRHRWTGTFAGETPRDRARRRSAEVRGDVACAS